MGQSISHNFNASWVTINVKRDLRDCGIALFPFPMGKQIARFGVFNVLKSVVLVLVFIIHVKQIRRREQSANIIDADRDPIFGIMEIV